MEPVMTDKTRQRHRLFRAPQGYLPNWIVALLAVGLATIGLLLNRLP
jgi:hypothetical protein